MKRIPDKFLHKLPDTTPRVRGETEHWMWGLLIFALIAGATVAGLHFNQQHINQTVVSALMALRDARIELTKGFLHMSSAGQPGLPYDARQGLALMNQALDSLDHTVALIEENHLVPPWTIDQHSAAMAESTAALRALIKEQQSQKQLYPGPLVKFRAAYYDLEYQMARLDSLLRRGSQRISHRLGLEFVFIVGLVLLLLIGMGFIVISAGRRQNQYMMALKESETRWQFALEGTGDGIWDWELPSNRVFYSKQWKAMLGYAEHEISDDFNAWLSLVHPDDVAMALKEIERHIKGETPIYTCEHRIRCKDGSYKWILDRGKIVSRTEDDRPLRMVGVHTDFSGRKQIEHDLKQAMQNAEAANNAKSRFLATISHDFRTPLNVIIGFSEMTLLPDDNEKLSDRQRENIRIVASSGRHLLNMVEGLLNISAIEAGKVQLQKEMINLHEIMTALIPTYELMATQKSIKLVSEVSASRSVPADLHRLTQILNNLVNNSIKYTPSGGTITIGATEEMNGVNIYVADTGIGIDAADIERIFKPYEQVEKSAAPPREKGVGLGLAIARVFIELHGGKLAVTSTPGQGSRFYFTLPYAESS
jgi:PAS domain S-box-containing protein